MRFIFQGKLCPSLDCDIKAFCQGSTYYQLGFWVNSEEPLAGKKPILFYLCSGNSGCNGRNIIQKEFAFSLAPSLEVRG